MNCFILILWSIILPISSLQQVKPKLCINCKYFIPDNGNGEFGKCSLFPNIVKNTDFLVNGVNKVEYYYCSTARSSNKMCDEEGKYYKKKVHKKNC
jgi:hypothetical protein